jgi:hypothetical protein
MAEQNRTNLEWAEKELSARKEIVDQTREEFKLHKATQAQLNTAIASMEQQRTIVEGIRKLESDRKEAIRAQESAVKSMTEKLAQVKEQVSEQLRSPFELPAEAQMRKEEEQIAGQRAKGIVMTPAMQQQRAEIMGNLAMLREFQRQQRQEQLERLALEQQQQFARERARTEIEAIPAPEIRELGKQGITRADVEQDINRAYAQRLDVADKLHDLQEDEIKSRPIEGDLVKELAKQQRDLAANNEAQKLAYFHAAIQRVEQLRSLNQRSADEEEAHRIQIAKMKLQEDEEDKKHAADLAMRRAELGFKGDNPAAGIIAAYRIVHQLNQDIYADHLKIIDLEEKGWEAEQDRERTKREYLKEEAKAREEMELKLAEMVQHQMETLKSTIEPLYKTLFEHPSKFGGELKSTLHEAAMKPIYSGLSEMTARALHPLIYGAGGTGGIAGVYHGIFGGSTGEGIKDLVLKNRTVPVTVEAVNPSLTAAGGGGGPGGVIGGISGQLGLPTGLLYRMGVTSPQVISPPSTGGWGAGGIPNTWTGGGATYPNVNPWIMSFGGGGGFPLLSGGGGGVPFGSSWGGAGGGVPTAGISEAWAERPTILQQPYSAGMAPLAGLPAQGYQTAAAIGTAAVGEAAAAQFGLGSWFPGGGGAALPITMPAGMQGIRAGTGGLSGILGGLGGVLGSFLRPAMAAPASPTASAAAAVANTGSSGAWSEIPGGPGGILGLPGGTPIDVSQLPGTTISSTQMPQSGLQGVLGKLGINPSMFAKSSWFNQGIATGAGGGLMGGFAGALTSPMAAQAMIGVGMPLAMSGLAGQSRGTWGGFGRSVGGGALTGAGIGTMIMPGLGTAIGAGIGAAAGAVSSLLEMAFGVESPRHEAIRLVKEKYGININNSTADQIVQIAQQSYASKVSLAVQSPEVRKMLGLYAAGTGQESQFKAGSMEAHGASLVESGGGLMQQATYQYGMAHTYASNLPVYGGVSSTQLSAPGGGMGMQVSLNIGGQDAARFMTGHVVTPDVVQSQMASAMYQSSGRINQALLMNSPGSIAA